MESLSNAAREQARERFSRLVGPVVLRVPHDDQRFRDLADELASLAAGDGTAETLLAVEEGPGDCLTLLDGWGRETGICFRHPPVGQEFPVLLDDIVAASRGGSVLSPLGRSQAQDLPEGSSLWVLVTPA